MKKTTIFFIVFLLSSAVVFSQEINYSVGLGITTGFDFNELTTKIRSGEIHSSWIQGGEYKQNYSQGNIGGLIFFDATFVEASVLFTGVSTTFKHNDTLERYTGVDTNWELGGVNLGLGLLGKYPVPLTDEWTLFPLLGAQYDIWLAQNFAKTYTSDSTIYSKTEKGDSYGKAIDWSALTLKAGVGVDYLFSESYFVRAELLYNFKLNSALDLGYIESISKGLKQYGDSYEDLFGLTMGFTVKIMVGYQVGGALIGRRQTPRRQPSGGDNIYYPR